MAAGLVLNSPQSPAICHSARKLPGVLMGPVCPSILSASAVTDFAVAKGTAPPGERAVGPTRLVSVFIGRQGAVPLDVSTLGMTRCSWESRIPPCCVAVFAFPDCSVRRKLGALSESFPSTFFVITGGTRIQSALLPGPLLRVRAMVSPLPLAS